MLLLLRQLIDNRIHTEVFLRLFPHSTADGFGKISVPRTAGVDTALFQKLDAVVGQLVQDGFVDMAHRRPMYATFLDFAVQYKLSSHRCWETHRLGHGCCVLATVLHQRRGDVFLLSNYLSESQFFFCFLAFAAAYLQSSLFAMQGEFMVHRYHVTLAGRVTQPLSQQCGENVNGCQAGFDGTL